MYKELAKIGIIADCVEKDGEHMNAYITEGADEFGLPNLVLICNMSEHNVRAILACAMHHWFTEKEAGKPITKGRLCGLFVTSNGDEAPAYISDIDILSPELPETIQSLIADSEGLHFDGGYSFYEETDPLPDVCQLIISDINGILPWESGFDHHFSHMILPQLDIKTTKH